jgi:hypothetical protein
LDVLQVPWHAKIFTGIWKSLTPSKVCGFVWQLLHNRIPTRNNLVIASGVDSVCPLCGVESETVDHLFLYSTVAKQVWFDIFTWLKVPFGLPHSRFSIFNCLLYAGDPKASKGRLMIYCAVLWMIWKFWNSVLFENGNGTVSELVERVKVTFWKWWLAR